VTSTEGAFNSGVLPAGAAFEHTFDTPGTHPYFCAIHPEMVGTVTVVGDAPAPTGDAVVESPTPAESPTPVESAATGDATPTDGVTAAEPAAVAVVDFTFEPPTIEVDAGATVTWTNEDSVPHTVTAREGDFDSGVLQTGDPFSQTFETPGTYEYFCNIHPSMTGMVVVRETATPAGESAAPDDATGAGATVVTEVSIVDVAFQPTDIQVPVGSTVDWVNDDPFAHTVTAREGDFDSGTMDAGAVYSETFDQAGSFDYFCAIHPSMTGTVTVTP
jgi:plastocyanin